MLIHHDKTKRLATELNISDTHAAGILHTLWEAATEYAFDGAFSLLNFPMMDFPRFEFEQTTRALCAAGWGTMLLDGRFYLHDYPEHCDKAVRDFLAAQHKPFADGTPSWSKPKKRACAEKPDGFERFWAVYPRRDARAAAESSWARLRPSLQLQETIVAAAHSYAQAKAETERQFICLPSTWLNQRRWEDESVANPTVNSLAGEVPVRTPTLDDLSAAFA